jgi:lipopolysaccharide exporter
VSLAVKAARGAIWVIASNVGGRIVGLVSTLVVLRFVAPIEYGGVAVATAIANTFDSFTAMGIVSYILANPKAPREVAFHSYFYFMSVGLVALAVAYIYREPLVMAFSKTPEEAQLALSYVPGMILAQLFLRIAHPAEVMLARDMRFAAVGTARGVGEVVYSGTTVVLAILGFGGMSIVYGNIVQWSLFTLMVYIASDVKKFMTPCKLTWEHTRTIFAFGIPMGIADFARMAGKQWDRLLVSKYFGQDATGRYNLAYNLADIPAMHVGEHIGDVLLPSFARLDDDERADGLIRATRLLSIIIFPLAVGLGAVAQSVTFAILNEKWAGMWPLLIVLSTLSVVRPVGWTVASFQVASQRPRVVMFLEILKTGSLVLAIWALAQLGDILWACVGVGVAFTLYAVGAVFSVKVTDHVPLGRLVGGLIGPLLACVPMVGAVFGVRYLLVSVGAQVGIVTLIAEIVAGGIAYVPSAFLFAPSTAKDLLSLIKRVLKRGGESNDDDEQGHEDGEAAEPNDQDADGSGDKEA